LFTAQRRSLPPPLTPPDQRLQTMASVAKMPCVADQLLIEEVRLHECLYAITTKSNRDNQQRDQAW